MYIRDSLDVSVRTDTGAASYVVVPCVWNVRQPDTFLETSFCCLILFEWSCTELYSLFCLTDCFKRSEIDKQNTKEKEKGNYA